MKYDPENCRLRDETGRPNTKAMASELRDAITSSIDRIDAMTIDDNTRYCRWASQQDNGRKPQTVGSRPAEPWPGAADVRERLADELVVDDVTLLKNVARRAKLTVKGTEASDLSRAGKTQILLDHLRWTKLRGMVSRETELAAQWRTHHGYALLAVVWDQQFERVYEEVTVEQLQQIAMQEPAGFAGQLLQMMISTEPDAQRSAVRLLQQAYPDLETREGYKQLQSLRVTGRMELPDRRLRVNEPRWEALKVGQDVFLPANTSTVGTARWIAWRETLNAAQIDNRSLAEQWPEEFHEAVKKTEGKTILEQLHSGVGRTNRREIFQDSSEQMAGLFEIFTFFYMEADDNGVPCLYRTVTSPHVRAPLGHPAGDPLYGMDGPLGYKSGVPPFVEIRRERPERLLLESRGITNLVATDQMEVKTFRDHGINQTELALQPPWVRPEREVGLPLKIQPRGEIGERRVNATRAMVIPNTAPLAKPQEVGADMRARRYLARNRAEDPVRTSNREQCLADDWCDELAEAWSMTLQLCQQFMGDAAFNRLVGGKEVPFTISREEIQGKFDLQLYFNTDSLDPERMGAKTELLGKVLLPMDRAGIIDTAPVVRGLFSYHLPEFADLALRDDNQASEAEVKDEQQNLGLMMAGVEPPMYPDGQNFALRLQWLENETKKPNIMMRLSSLPDSREFVDRRVEHLRFMVEQKTINAQAGRVGVRPQVEGATA